MAKAATNRTSHTNIHAPQYLSQYQAPQAKATPSARHAPRNASRSVELKARFQFSSLCSGESHHSMAPSAPFLRCNQGKPAVIERPRSTYTPDNSPGALDHYSLPTSHCHSASFLLLARGRPSGHQVDLAESAGRPGRRID